MKARATMKDLYKVEGKADLIKGEIVSMSLTGGGPGKASLQIARRLLDFEERVGGGYAFPNNIAFAVKLPHRESFSPDTSWYVGPPPDKHFPQGTPFLPSQGYKALRRS
jgi:Uma2 family endonuclease